MKKFMILIILTLFMLPAVSASDIDETVNIDNGEIQVQEFSQNEIIEFVEVDQIDFEEFQLDDIVVKDVIGEDEPLQLIMIKRIMIHI